MTKFAPPRLGRGSILRDRLLGRLEGARDRKLVLITGGAGFGKTTLLAQLRRRCIASGATAAWLSLGSEEKIDPSTLCASLIGALQHIGVPLEDDLALLGEMRTAGVHAALAALSGSVMRLPGELYLLIDNFEYITDPASMKLLQRVIDAAPPNMHIVLSSRTAPLLLLGRLRAMRELEEISGAELAFDFRESVAFLEFHLETAIDLDSARQIYDLTHGWPIGLQLASIVRRSGRNSRARLGFMAAANENLDAYLSEDVIAHLPHELIEFMQRASILQRFNAEVAAEVTGFATAGALIAELEGKNLFVLPVELEASTSWYRFHPMFADFLTQRLMRSSTDTPELHRRAARWFTENDSIWEGMHHALLGGDFDGVVRILEHPSSLSTRANHLGTLARWIDRVPRDVLLRHPQLLMMAAWAYALTGRPDDAERWIAEAENSQWPVQGYSRELKLLRVALAILRDDTARVLDLVQSFGDAPFEDQFLENMRLGMTIGGYAYLGRHGDARSVFNSPAARVARSRTDEMALIISAAGASAALIEGNVLEAKRLGAAALTQAETIHGRRSISACVSASVMARVLYERNLLDDSRETLANRLDILRLSSPVTMMHAACCYGRLLSLQLGPREALSYLVEEEAQFRGRHLDRGVAHMLAEQLAASIKLGDRRHGEALLAALDVLKEQHRADFPRDAEIVMVALIAHARFALAIRVPDRAVLCAQEARTIAARYGRDNMVVTCDVLQALALGNQRRKDEALSYMRLAVASGYRLGLLRTFLDEGSQVDVLLADLQYPDGDPLQPYVYELIEHSRRGSDCTLQVGAALDDEVHPTQFTTRELEILALLDRTMSNKHIALALNISIQTVKWNLKRIFAKLGVSSRYDAIIRARGLGLTGRARP